MSGTNFGPLGGLPINNGSSINPSNVNITSVNQGLVGQLGQQFKTDKKDQKEDIYTPSNGTSKELNPEQTHQQATAAAQDASQLKPEEALNKFQSPVVRSRFSGNLTGDENKDFPQ